MRRYFFLAVASLLGLLAAYLIDVWLLGSLSALILTHGLSIFPHPTHSRPPGPAPAWYWQHPMQTAWAWATRANAQLAAPNVRMMWAAINAVLMLGLFVFKQ